MTSGSEFAALFHDLARPRSIDSLAYELRADLNGSYLGRAPSGRPAFLVPVRHGPTTTGRKSGHLSLQSSPQVAFEMGDARWESPAVVIECDDDTHLRTFCALALDIARNIGQPHEQPSARQVSEYLFHWEALLRNQRRLSAEEELGLWGELWVIRSCGLPSLDRAVANWRGPERARVDFVGAGVGVEVKTSLTRLRHTIRHSQAERPLGDLDAYLVSLWVAVDATAGETVPELLETVAVNVLDAPSFEAKLSAYGYSHADAASYDRRLTLLEQPLIFRIDGIPRVRSFDEGVTDIRYSVQLDPATALSDGDAQVVWDRIFATH